MPQLDIVILSNQFFWFFGVFSGVYIFMTYVIIPKINFYYFIRYNIQSVFLQSENLMNLSVFSGDISVQTRSELSFVYSHRLRWFHEDGVNMLPVSTDPAAGLGKHLMVQMQNHILVFFLAEISLGQDTDSE
jgi:hypothetical protein